MRDKSPHPLEFISWIFGIAVATLSFYQAYSQYDGKSTESRQKSALSEKKLESTVVKPSFDCLKAKQKTEIMICGNPALAKLDLQLDKVYRETIERNPYNKKEIYNRQITWWKLRNLCSNEKCIMDKYNSRIFELRNN
jgi:uncharacterized protein